VLSGKLAAARAAVLARFDAARGPRTRTATGPPLRGWRPRAAPPGGPAGAGGAADAAVSAPIPSSPPRSPAASCPTPGPSRSPTGPASSRPGGATTPTSSWSATAGGGGGRWRTWPSWPRAAYEKWRQQQGPDPDGRRRRVRRPVPEGRHHDRRTAPGASTANLTGECAAARRGRPGGAGARRPAPTTTAPRPQRYPRRPPAGPCEAAAAREAGPRPGRRRHPAPT